MISMPNTFRLILSLIAILPLTLLARQCLAKEPTTIHTRGFSVTFSGKWRVETDRNGTILGSVRGEASPFIIINYADDQMSNDGPKGNVYERMKRSSIADIIGKDGASFLNMSKWHRRENLHRPDGITEEQLEFYSVLLDDEGKPTGACFFERLYHGAPHAELFLTFVVKSTCDAAREEFNAFEASIVWK